MVCFGCDLLRHPLLCTIVGLVPERTQDTRSDPDLSYWSFAVGILPSVLVGRWSCFLCLRGEV